MSALSWRFDNSYARLPDLFHSAGTPEPVRQPRLVLFNEPLAEQLGLQPAGADRVALAALFAGNRLPAGAHPIAQAYAGHQFGHFTVLGDGRALLLGEHLDPQGRRHDIHFKGTGPTPYSRQGDGRAALGPMLREYIISEAMHALGIPTSRSLAVTATGEPVYRETVLPGAVLTRVAASHLRVGTMEYAAARSDRAALAALVDYTIQRHAPDLAQAELPALALLRTVIGRQAALLAEWMRVGFVHGVMNTDNMTLSGETIDYGPCAFLDAYDPGMAFSSIDRGRRYAFGNQPPIAQWNLARLAEALLPLIDPDTRRAIALAEEAVAGFRPLFDEHWLAMMRRKLGLFGAEPGDRALAEDFLEGLHRLGADYTNSFRALVQGAVPPAMAEWGTRWQARRARQAEPPEAARALMAASNPAVIPRNHKVEQALAAAVQEGDLGPLQALLAVLSEPTRDHPGLEDYRQPNPAPEHFRTFCGT